ncbi:DUF3574 domain-containing protein [Limobrevibacterium gyesilva]|uniref:DUF3574 domain-containing protein n=1 Tax=Limobrevibacterium gyesilva TaxID=2991712 RepID=UPI0024C171BE|nr:DUF3574 domain-containing protein [Limobrevibacterium gyesilva]
MAACAASPPAARCAGMRGDPAITVQLLFGRSLRGGGKVGDVAWRDFLAAAVTPRFPDGLTVLDGYGQWRQRATGRVISEPSTVVEIVTEASPDTFQRLDAIRTEYKAQFVQDSVGLVVSEACASF